MASATVAQQHQVQAQFCQDKQIVQQSTEAPQRSAARRFFKPRYLLGLAILAGIVVFFTNRRPARPSANQPVSVNASGLVITVQLTDGSYSVKDSSTGWTFFGAVNQRVSPPQTRSGSDRIGKYTSICFDWDDKGPVSGEIRGYLDQPAVMFVLTCKSARSAAPSAFPCLTTPVMLHPFGYSNSVFSPRSFKGGSAASPWLLFDDAAKAVIVSPADNFMTADIRRDKQNNLACGFNGKLANLPDGFSHKTLLVPADSIHQAWERWGRMMTDLTGKIRPANDQAPELGQLGYWTDNGATYYYNFDKTRSYQATLLDIAAAYHKLNIPLAYMQLDSWWYYKSTTGSNGKAGDLVKNKSLPKSSWNCYGGLMEYVAHPEVFPEGLPAFEQQLGIPLITHNRWIDVNSPYHEKYKISGVAAIDPKWWDEITDYLKSAGVIVYEQDWLNEIYINSPEFSSTTTAGDLFMDNMARATRERGMRMQYCMELPQHYMQGSKYDNLTSVRVAGDRFERGKWELALYTSQLAAALGEWPWVDTFNSSETANLILATLTAGPVVFGDPMDKIDAKNIATCIRPDGVIVKPETAIVPLDQVYLSDVGEKKSPMIAAAYTDHGPHRTAYVFSFPRSASQKNISLRPMDLGISTDAWVYEPETGKGVLIPAGGTFTAGFADENVKKAWSYFIVAPVGSSGIALIGDAGKITSMGRQRVSSVEESADHFTTTLAFANGEGSIMLHGFCRSNPIATAAGGSVEPMEFDPDTHEFRVTVKPAGGTAKISLAVH